ncbi:Sensor protein ChvG [Methylocella tundrae]|uniref:histidine kinase n=1 Tax=Methylocella tundrae TaxID=227605 RepID=A0A8B6M438_METTU|nr:stimulus-sensing domain-containing protein [Methylocella tundrae]VTZ49787.1 Sensor protein ChvG [Methylocella tundrae]
MSLEAQQDLNFERTRVAAQRAKRMRRSFSARLRGLLRSLSSRFSSSLTRRIVVLNLGGLVALLVGFLYLNQFREGLIDARVQSLQTQAEIIAAAVAASATVDTDSITIDPEKLLQLAPGESYGLADDSTPSLQFSINPERVGPVLRRLASPTRTRARIYDRDGYLLLDSRSLTSRSNILRFDLPPTSSGEKISLIERLWSKLTSMLWRSDLPLYEENGVDNGRNYPEVIHALGGGVQSIVRVNVKGETIVSIAAPIQRFRVVRGALLLSTEGGDIDKIIASERWAIVRVFLVSVIIMFLLSLFIAGTIAEPIRHLAEAAERVRRGTKLRREIPDFTDRSDEIGHLSGALRDMTKALYNRIDAIESFAADVAHELKNPLTSLRSAVETLPNAKKPESQQRLLAVIEHDVRRLDRLISDISDASRLDAELARADMDQVDLELILKTVTAISNQIKAEPSVQVSLTIARLYHDGNHRLEFSVLGHDSRLGQVFNNLIDNARSFSNPGGWVRVHMRPAKDCTDDGYWRDGFEITVDDDGPGIPADAFDRIFDRFYTDRPNQGFGQNSGLGLSISRQIIEAHGGRISARNRLGAMTEDEEAPVLGARLTIWLPKG